MEVSLGSKLMHFVLYLDIAHFHKKTIFFTLPWLTFLTFIYIESVLDEKYVLKISLSFFRYGNCLSFLFSFFLSDKLSSFLADFLSSSFFYLGYYSIGLYSEYAGW